MTNKKEKEKMKRGESWRENGKVKEELLDWNPIQLIPVSLTVT